VRPLSGTELRVVEALVQAAPQPRRDDAFDDVGDDR
jgi:hypothetical protein